MTAPDVLLAGARKVLDQLEQQARAADDKVNHWWWRSETIARRFPTTFGDTHRPDAAHIAVWSPSFVLTVVGLLRATVDGWEQVLERHRELTRLSWPDPDYAAALAGLERLASLDMTGAKR